MILPPAKWIKVKKCKFADDFERDEPASHKNCIITKEQSRNNINFFLTFEMILLLYHLMELKPEKYNKLGLQLGQAQDKLGYAVIRQSSSVWATK